MSELEKVRAAAAATQRVQDRAGKALQVLTESFSGRGVNGWGAYSDPGATRDALRVAAAVIQQALDELDRTAWPSNAEYDRAQEEHEADQAAARARRDKWPRQV